MSLGLAGTVAAYIVLAVLLLSLNLRASWTWWVKAGAIGVTTLFYAGSYVTISALLGWPTHDRLPENFQFVSSRIVEPDRATGEVGAIYLWIADLDEDNVPDARPRAFELPYSDELANRINDAQNMRDEGIEVAGKVEFGEEARQDKPLEIGEMDEKNAEQTSKMDTMPFLEQDLRVTFQELPPVTLPPKPPL
jgi:hypothetical protein